MDDFLFTTDEFAMLIALVGANLDPCDFPNSMAKATIYKARNAVEVVGGEVTVVREPVQAEPAKESPRKNFEGTLYRKWVPSETESDKDYMVTYRVIPFTGTERDFRCTCLAFCHASWSDHFECKHIRKLKALREE